MNVKRASWVKTCPKTYWADFCGYACMYVCVCVCMYVYIYNIRAPIKKRTHRYTYKGTFLIQSCPETLSIICGYVCVWVCMCTHTHTNTHTHTLHTHMPAHAHTQMHILRMSQKRQNQGSHSLENTTRIYIQTCARKYGLHTSTHTRRRHTWIHISRSESHLLACTCTQTNTHTYGALHTHTYRHTHTEAYAHLITSLSLSLLLAPSLSASHTPQQHTDLTDASNATKSRSHSQDPASPYLDSDSSFPRILPSRATSLQLRPYYAILPWTPRHSLPRQAFPPALLPACMWCFFINHVHTCVHMTNTAPTTAQHSCPLKGFRLVSLPEPWSVLYRELTFKSVAKYVYVPCCAIPLWTSSSARFLATFAPL